MISFKVNSTLTRILFLLFILQAVLLAQDQKQAETDAPAGDPYSELKQEMREKLEAIEERLELSDEQRESFRPVIKASGEQRLVVLKRFGVEPENLVGIKELGFRKKIKLRGEMQAIDKNTEKELKDILSGDQLKLWKEIEEERRVEMQKKMKG